jgi:hypothetical protein
VRAPVRVGLGVALAVGFALGLGALTRVPYSPVPGDEAELRLTWRARAAPAEECRRLTEAEQEALPVHMRREVVCEGRVASYALEVVVDGVVTHQRVVEGAGARGDRPLYVYDALRLAPGHHDVHVVFERVNGASAPEDRAGGVPDRLELRERIEVGAGDVVLVTYDAANRRLVVRGR